MFNSGRADKLTIRGNVNDTLKRCIFLFVEDTDTLPEALPRLNKEIL